MTSTNQPGFRVLFAQQMKLQEADLELDRATLYLAGEADSGLDVDNSLSRIDEIAAQIRAQLSDSPGQQEIADALNIYLFQQLGYSGNPDDYYNPDNSFLHRVLETRIGIPITLSVLYMEVGRRLGLACRGVGLPGHFVVSLEDLGLYLDPYNSGGLLSSADCRRMVEDLFGSQINWQEDFLSPCTKRDILYRMLNNLKMIYIRSRDYPKAIGALERMGLTSPSVADLHKELSWCYLQLGEHQLAIRQLETYLRVAEDPSDSDEVQQQIKDLWTASGRLN
jgi:regulator of sirC expression with transglutaminase-like and TPR domain